MKHFGLLLFLLYLSSCPVESSTNSNGIKDKQHGKVDKIEKATKGDVKVPDGAKEVQHGKVKKIEIAFQNTLDTKHDTNIDLVPVKEGKEKDSKHILMFHPWGTKSHRGQLNALLLGLLEAGHKVTGVFPNKSDIKNEGFTEIVVKDGMGIMIQKFTEMIMKEGGNNIFTLWSNMPMFFEQYDLMFDQILLDYKTVTDFIEEKNLTVDALMVTGMFHYNSWYLQRHYNCPLIMINPMGPLPHITKWFGNIENPSFQPLFQLGFVEPMDFFQRLANTLYYAFEEFWMRIMEILLPNLKNKLGVSFSDMAEMSESFSLLLLCSHFVTHSPQAFTANTVEVGGIHCRDGQPLPDDLQQFLDSSPEGVVYVSFGSAVKPNQMTPERKEIFLETFRQLKTPVIWKWNEDTIPNLPPNVMLSKWLPQQDLLAHPNLKVFVTHGGLLSLQEALYHQVPLVGIPLGNDQIPNLLRAQQKGYSVMLDWTTLDTPQFVAAINTARNDEKMKKKMKTMHDLFTDQKETPVERAVWWIEYVIRNEGAQFLKPKTQNLSWYQFYLLDVIGLVILVLLIILFIVVKCCICCKNLCCAASGRQLAIFGGLTILLIALSVGLILH